MFYKKWQKDAVMKIGQFEVESCLHFKKMFFVIARNTFVNNNKPYL